MSLLDKIKAMSLVDAQRTKAEQVASAKTISAKLSDPDFAGSAERSEDLTAEMEDHLSNAEAAGGRIAEVQASQAAAIERQTRFAALEASGEAPAQPRSPGQPGTGKPKITATPSFENDPMKGFASPKEFFGTIIDLSQRDPKAGEDHRVKYLATAGTDEHSGQSDPYGGLLVPVAMSPDVKSVGADTNPLLGRVTNVPMQARSLEILARVDKNHATSVSGGLTVSRRDETNGINSSRMEMEKVTLKATGLFGLAYSTRELMQDSPMSVSALLGQGFADEFPAAIYNEMLNGNTTGKLEGIINTPATVIVAKEGGQTADTIVGANLLKMRQQAWRYGGGFWLANQDTYVQILSAHTALTNDDYPLFIHGNGTDVPDTLLGQPIFFNEFSSTLGDLGDIVLVSRPDQYLYGTYQPLRSEESMHVRFENHEQAFKFWTENAGAPWWRSPLTPKNGANTLSPFVTLAARA